MLALCMILLVQFAAGSMDDTYSNGNMHSNDNMYTNDDSSGSAGCQFTCVGYSSMKETLGLVVVHEKAAGEDANAPELVALSKPSRYVRVPFNSNHIECPTVVDQNWMRGLPEVRWMTDVSYLHRADRFVSFMSVNGRWSRLNLPRAPPPQLGPLVHSRSLDCTVLTMVCHLARE